jgi:hypothetical protein
MPGPGHLCGEAQAARELEVATWEQPGPTHPKDGDMEAPSWRRTPGRAGSRPHVPGEDSVTVT